MDGDHDRAVDSEKQPSLTAAPREATASIADAPGSLYVRYGARTAGAVATAAVGKDPRRRAYMRRMVAIALIVGAGGSALALAIALLVD